MRFRPLIALSLACALAACDREAPAPTPTLQPTASPTPEQKTSIIRDDVGFEREPAPVQGPLDIVIGFPDGGADLSEEAIAQLGAALESEQMKGGGAISVGGHTDSTGPDAANLRAARRRAETVRDWLVKEGVAEDRIKVIAFGEQNPIAPNARPDGTPSESGRAKNRRVELSIAAPPGAPPAAAESEVTLVDELTAPAED